MLWSYSTGGHLGLCYNHTWLVDTYEYVTIVQYWWIFMTMLQSYSTGGYLSLCYNQTTKLPGTHGEAPLCLDWRCTGAGFGWCDWQEHHLQTQTMHLVSKSCCLSSCLFIILLSQTSFHSTVYNIISMEGSSNITWSHGAEFNLHKKVTNMKK